MKANIDIRIDTDLIAKLLESLQTPYIAMMFGMLGTLIVFGWIFIAYIKANKESQNRQSD